MQNHVKKRCALEIKKTLALVWTTLKIKQKQNQTATVMFQLY